MAPTTTTPEEPTPQTTDSLFGQPGTGAQEARVRPTLTCGPSRTKQSFKEESLMSTIMNKWRKGESIAENRNEPQFGDFTGVDDYHTAISAIRDAEQDFLGLPSALRDRFGNDPGQLLDYLSDPGNREDSIRLGLVADPGDQADPPPNQPPAEQEPEAQAQLEPTENPPAS